MIALVPVVYMHDSLLGLRSIDMRLAHCKAVLCSRALLERLPYAGQWLQFIDEDADIF